jgi:nitroreductase
MDLLDGIYTRRSIRRFAARPVKREDLLEIIKAGTWAPSGMNNQPWRFVLIRQREVLDGLAGLTRYRKVLEGAPSAVAVFVDREAMYHETKDLQAMGACLQNMLLAAHALGLGAVWLGEILKNAGKARALLELPDTLELMAVLAVGHPGGKAGSSGRRPLEEVLLKEL